MIRIDRRWIIAGLTAASLQTAAIGWMVWDRISLLRTGREIVLPIVPVDPRSLFRGDYVILDYPVSNVPGTTIGADLKAAKPGQFYVTLAKQGDDWQVVGTSQKQEAATSDQVVIKAKPRYGWYETTRPQPRPPAQPSATPGATTTPAPVTATPPERVLRVRYGIESYFVPEGKGRALEKMARERKLAALIAVDAKGNAAIKGLMIDGKLQYEEPLL